MDRVVRSFDLPGELYTLLEKKAKEEHRTVAGLVKHALWKYLGEVDREESKE